MFEHAEDSVKQFAHDGDQGDPFGFAAGAQMFVEGMQVGLPANGDQGGHVEGAAQVAGQRILMGGSTSWLRHADAVGTTTMLTDQTGAVDGDVEYYPWGRLWGQIGDIDGNAFGDLGFQVNYPLPPSATRDYNPGSFRWTTPDHLGGDVTNPQSLNRYAYALNNPVSNNDPSGLITHNPDDGTTVDVSGINDLLRLATEDTMSGGGGGGAAPKPTNLGPPQSQAQNNACTQPILNAVSNQFGPGTYSVTNTFPQGGATDLQITATNLTASQFNAFQTGRYPLKWWTYVIGYGPTLHVTGATLFDPNAYFSNSNIGGWASVNFTAHIDSAFAYNPIGWLIHFLVDKLHIGGPRNQCP